MLVQGWDHRQTRVLQRNLLISRHTRGTTDSHKSHPQPFRSPASYLYNSSSTNSVGAHMISHVNIFTSVTDIAKTRGFFLFMSCTYLMVYIIFYYCVFLLMSCSRRPEMSHWWLCTHTIISAWLHKFSMSVSLWRPKNTGEFFLHLVPPQHCDKD